MQKGFICNTSRPNFFALSKVDIIGPYDQLGTVFRIPNNGFSKTKSILFPLNLGSYLAYVVKYVVLVILKVIL